MDAAKNKGCDGIIPLNLTTYLVDSATSGFSLTEQHQLAYDNWLATEATSRDLTIGIINDPTHSKELLSKFHFAMDEDCFIVGNSCYDSYVSFINANKPVFIVEYNL